MAVGAPSLTPWLLRVAVFALSLGLYSINWFQGLKGGISTVGAARVLQGEIPYRDFWTIYAPGHYYLLALLFRVFGSHLLVEVVAASVICAVAATLCVRLGTLPDGRRGMGVLAAVVFVAASYATHYWENLGSYPPAALFAFLALGAFGAQLRESSPGSMALSGAAVGAAVVFKHDVGGYTGLAIAAGLMAQGLSGERRLPRSWWLAAFAFVGTALAVVAPVAVYFWFEAGPETWRDLVVFPLTDFRFARPESYPPLLPPAISGQSTLEKAYGLFRWANLTIPFLLFACGAVATLHAARRGERQTAIWGATLSIVYLLHYAAAHVQINTHLISLSVYGFLLGALALREMPRAARGSIRGLAVVGFAGWIVALAAKPIFVTWRNHGRLTAVLHVPAVSGFRVAGRDASVLEGLRRFVDERIAPDARIYVGLHRHDVVIISDPLLYFVLGRRAATRYHELHPGIADTAAVQREIVADLDRHGVEILVLKRIFADGGLDDVKRKHRQNLPLIGATDLDDFIRTHFRPVAEFGSYAVWQRS